MLAAVGKPLVHRLVGALQRAVDTRRGHLERRGRLARRVAEHVAEDEHGALARRQVLERRDEGELDALALLVARLRAGEPVLDAQRLIRIGLHPDRFDEGLGQSVPWVGRRGVVDRQHALGPALDRPQAGVGRDRVEPRAQRASPLELGQPAPRVQQRLLERVLGVGHRAEHPVAVGVQGAAVGLNKPSEGVLVARAGRREELRLVHDASRTDGRGALGCQNAISPPTVVPTTLRHPTGPSRGSSRTDAPSSRARSVAAAISGTST